jgi:hypothetical protein
MGKAEAHSSGIANKAANRADQLIGNAMPTVEAWGEKAPDITRVLGDQILSALQTGGVGAQIPIINRAQEGSRQATSNALRGVDDSLGKFNLAGTPYGEALRANTTLAGETATNRIPTDTASQFITGAMPYITASPGVGTAAPGLQAGTAIGNQTIQAKTAADVANKQATSQMISAGIGAIGSIGGAAAKGGG